MVEGARLESVCVSNGTVSSNLILSANKYDGQLTIIFIANEIGTHGRQTCLTRP